MQNIPTDNLYKFLAITGVIAVLASINFGFHQIEVVVLERIELEAELAGFQQELRVFQAQSEGADVYRQAADEAGQLVRESPIEESIESTETRRVLISSYSKAAKKSLDATTELAIASMDLANTSAHIEAHHEKIKFLIYERNVLLIVYIFMFLIGVSMAFFGFYSWYFKLQCFQDEIIKREVSSMNKY